MANSNRENAGETQSVGDVVAAACKVAKIDTINGLPAMPVSGDVGNGFLCVPASVDDLAWVTGVPDAARPFILSAALRAAMQRGQAALKAFDKKNKDAADSVRIEKAQTAFTASLAGTDAPAWQESSVILDEALRRFKGELQPKVAAGRPGQVTDDAFMDAVLADIKKNRADAYNAKVEALSNAVRSERIYSVSRKGQTDAPSIDTSALEL